MSASASAPVSDPAPTPDPGPTTTSTLSGDGDRRWPATELVSEGVRLGNFALAASPSPTHPRGLIAAVAFGATAGTETATWLVAIDPGSGRTLSREAIGISTRDTTLDVARTPYGVLVARQQESGLDLQWFAEGTVRTDKRSLPDLASKKPEDDLRGLAVFGDRIVLVTGGFDTTTVRILDGELNKGKVLDKHACRGSLFNPGDAQLVQVGDLVIVTNLVGTPKEPVPVCAGRLHEPDRWREVALHDGRLYAEVGGVSFQSFGDAGRGSIHTLDENLQPTGPAPPYTEPHVECKGQTGSYERHGEEIAGLWVVYMGVFPGDEGGGLFVCRPPEQGR